MRPWRWTRNRAQPLATAARTGRRRETPIVPLDSIAGRALVSVIAIMTFLSALTVGAVVLVSAAAGEWQSNVAREVTIQIRPLAGRDSDADVAAAIAIAAAQPGIDGVQPYSKQESAALLEPWLGTGLSMDDLPVPRLIVVKLAGGPAPNLDALRREIAERIPGASLDDHRAWIDRMRTMANSLVALGLGVLGLVLAATVLSVMFATRGAMATNRPIIEVLHFVGARDGFVAGEFQRHFLMLGLKGGVIGGARRAAGVRASPTSWATGSAARPARRRSAPCSAPSRSGSTAMPASSAKSSSSRW